jgi:hypothetical protein
VEEITLEELSVIVDDSRDSGSIIVYEDFTDRLRLRNMGSPGLGNRESWHNGITG